MQLCKAQHLRAGSVLMIIADTARGGVSSAHRMLAASPGGGCRGKRPGWPTNPWHSVAIGQSIVDIVLDHWFMQRSDRYATTKACGLCGRRAHAGFPVPCTLAFQAGPPSAQHSCQQHRALQRRPRRKESHAGHGAPRARSCRQRVPELWKLQTQLLPTCPHFVETGALEPSFGQGLLARRALGR